jgi:hypothetical protein
VNLLSKIAGEQRLIASNSVESDQDLGMYVISHGYRLSPNVDVARLRRCLDTIVKHVPVLRAVFDEHPIVASTMYVADARNYFTTHPTIGTEDAAPVKFCEACSMMPISYFEGPLFRADITKGGDTGYVLMLSWDHAIADAWTVSLCLKWLSDLYNRGCALPDGAAQWPAFVQQEVDAIRMTPDPGKFWASQLVSAQPAEFPGRADAALSGQAESFLTRLAGRGFNADCRRVGATRGVIALAAAFAACGVFSNAAGGTSAASVLPTVLSNRDEQFTETVGLLMRTVLVRLSPNDVAAAPKVHEIRSTLMRQLGAMYTYRHESLVYLFERYRASLDQFCELPLPLFVQLVDVPARELVLDGCTVDCVYRGFEKSSRFAVEVHIRPAPDGGIEALFIYDRLAYSLADMHSAAANMKRWIRIFSDPSMSGKYVYSIDMIDDTIESDNTTSAKIE